MTKMKRGIAHLVLIFAMLFVAAAPAAFACTCERNASKCEGAGGGGGGGMMKKKIRIIIIRKFIFGGGPVKASITVTNLRTAVHLGVTIPFRSKEGETCAAGLSFGDLTPFVENIENVNLVDALTGDVLTSFDVDMDGEWSPLLTELAESEGVPASSFFAFTSPEFASLGVPEDHPVNINLDVDLTEGISIDDLANVLTEQGAFVATAANADMTSGGHVTVGETSEVDVVQDPCPEEGTAAPTGLTLF